MNNLTDFEIELNVLAFLIYSKNMEVKTKLMTSLDTKCFAERKNQAIFSTIQKMIGFTTLSKNTVLAKGIEFGFFQKDEEEEFNILLTVLENKDLKEETKEDEIEILSDLSKRRFVSTKLDVIKNNISDRKITLTEALKDFASVTETMADEEYIITSPYITQKRNEGLKKRVEIKGGYKTGFENLDDMMNYGFYPGMITVIAGRPGMGKSMVKNNIMANLLDTNCNVCNFCLEQDYMEEIDRLTSIKEGIPLDEIIRVYDWKRGDKRIEKIMRLPKEMDRRANISFINKRTMFLSESINIINMLNQQKKINVAFFDLFDRFIDISRSENKSEVIFEKITMLSEWARMFQFHPILVIQVNRDPETRKDHRPRVSDLRSSDAYGQVAHMILLVYRENYYNENIFDCPFEINLAKQRDGAGKLGTAKFDVYPDTMTLKPVIGV